MAEVAPPSSPADPGSAAPADAGNQPPPPSAEPGGSSPAPPPAAPSGEGGPQSAGGGGPDQTLMGGGGGEDPPVQAPAQFPTNWRDIMAGGDEKTLQYLNRYTNPANVVKGLMNLRGRMDSGAMARARPEGEAENPEYQEQLSQWRAEIGLPTEPTGYLENMPDGIVLGEQDQEIAGSFLEAMHNADAPPGFVHQALKWYTDLNENKIVQQAESDNRNRTEAEEDLRGKWGAEFRPHMNNMANTFAAYGSADLYDKIASARAPDGRLLGDDPEFLSAMVAMSQAINPHGTIVPGEGQTPIQTIDAELDGLRKEMADQHSGYYRGPEAEKKQARYRELLTLKDQYESRGS